MYFIQKQVINKIENLKVNDLLYYADQYKIKLNKSQAQQIIAYLQSQNIETIDKETIENMWKELATITNKETAKQCQKIFDNLIKSYHLESFFK